ncbi:Zinc knuckle, partial [Popillia japonica]
MKLKESDSLEEHFMKFETITRELKSVGGKLEEVDIVCQLLLTLPSSYDPIVTALETLDPQKLTLEFVKSKLLDQELKKNSTQLEDTRAAFSSKFGNKGSKFNRKTNQGKIFKCYNCGKLGHKKVDCRLKKQVNEARNEESHIAFVTGGQSTEETSDDIIKWYIDSGATDHMVNLCSYFCEVKEIDPMKISVAKENASLSATKIGTINVNISSRYTHNGYRLWDVEKNKVVTARNVIFDENKTISDVKKERDKSIIIVEETPKYEDIVTVSNEEKEDDIESTIRRSTRERKLPSYLEDFEIGHEALSAESFVDDVPKNLENAKS